MGMKILKKVCCIISIPQILISALVSLTDPMSGLTGLGIGVLEAWYGFKKK